MAYFFELADAFRRAKVIPPTISQIEAFAGEYHCPECGRVFKHLREKICCTVDGVIYHPHHVNGLKLLDAEKGLDEVAGYIRAMFRQPNHCSSNGAIELGKQPFTQTPVRVRNH